MSYPTFLPNYYSTLVKSQQQALVLDNLYFYVADGVTTGAVANTAAKTTYDEQQTINQIMYGGRVLPENMVAMIRRVEWTAGKVFAAYDSRDPKLNEKDFYCLTSSRRVYKCLQNNNGSPSQYEPNSSVPGAFTTSDGYVWMYMYSLSEPQLANYSIQNMIPVFVDPAVTAASIRGTITSIEVIDGGNYNKVNHGVIQNKQSNTVYRISDLDDSVSGTYNGMTIYINSGPGQGQMSTISSYVANTSGKFVTLSSAITTDVTANYSIVPTINIQGNGFSGAARAVMSGNSISKVEIINQGSEYTLANATATTNDITSTAAQLQVNLSPPKGHGYDILNELYCDHTMISINLDNFNYDPRIPIDQLSFSKVGLIRILLQENNPTQIYNDPEFSNMFIAQITPSFGQFDVGDTISIVTNENKPPYGKVVYANNSHIIGVYQTPLVRFTPGNPLINQNGISGLLTDITQPDVKLLMSDVVAQINVDTVERSEDSSEILQILIKVRIG